MSTIVSNLSLSIQKAATAGLFALTVLGTSSAIAQQTAVQQTAQKPTVPVVAQQDEEETAVPNKPDAQGIKVHGHWVIDVKDKDGKVVEHRDFHNSLMGSGAQLLVGLLTGSSTPANFDVTALYQGANQTSGGYVMYPTGTPTVHYNCTAAPDPQNCFPNLTVTSVAASAASLINLQGQFTASAASSVTDVYTGVGVCISQVTPSAVSPATCYNTVVAQTGSSIFTHATLATPLAVAAGQTVAVTVTLSFS